MWMLPARVSAVGKWTLRATAFLNVPMISTVLQPGVFFFNLWESFLSFPSFPVRLLSSFHVLFLRGLRSLIRSPVIPS